MTHINEKMGLRPAGKRSMMKLPKRREDAVAITAAICPQCQRTGAIATPRKGPRWMFCTWCSHTWEREA